MYATQADIEARFAAVRVWTDDAGAGAANAANVAAAIADAEAQIDAALAQQYALPLTLGSAATRGLLRRYTTDIAAYLLASRVWEGTAPENVRKLYEDALAWLAQLAVGKVFLPGEAAAAVERPGGGVVVAGDDAVITRETMDGL